MTGRDSTLAAQIDALLPQTQCTRCGYPACRPYADAIARGEAGINQCPPGGDAGVAALAALLNREVLPLDPQFGAAIAQQRVAVIDEALCIGCTKCIQACPVDAIVGAAACMHTVIADECSGCELCIAPCPVDCIAMVETGEAAAPLRHAPQYRRRYEQREVRLQQIEAATRAERERRRQQAGDPVARARALARARLQKPTS